MGIIKDIPSGGETVFKNICTDMEDLVSKSETTIILSYKLTDLMFIFVLLFRKYLKK